MAAGFPEFYKFDPLTEEEQSLAAQWLPLAYKWARFFSRRTPDRYDDYLDIAQKVLLHTVRDFDRTKGTFATLFIRRMRGEIGAYNRIESLRGMSGHTAIKREGIRVRVDTAVEFATRSCDHPADQIDDAQEVAKYLSVLTKSERGLLYDYYGGRPTAEIAKDRGITPAGVHWQMKTALKKIRDHFGIDQSSNSQLS